MPWAGGDSEQQSLLAVALSPTWWRGWDRPVFNVFWGIGFRVKLKIRFSQTV